MHCFNNTCEPGIPIDYVAGSYDLQNELSLLSFGEHNNSNPPYYVGTTEKKIALIRSGYSRFPEYKKGYFNIIYKTLLNVIIMLQNEI